jgi:hypothetical protein
MTADKALTKDEFAEKYGQNVYMVKPPDWTGKTIYDVNDLHNSRPLIKMPDPKFLSDLNALLREELILHAEHDWRRTFDKSDLVPALSWELNKERVINDIDEYLKSQQ